MHNQEFPNTRRGRGRDTKKILIDHYPNFFSTLERRAVSLSTLFLFSEKSFFFQFIHSVLFLFSTKILFTLGAQVASLSLDDLSSFQSQKNKTHSLSSDYRSLFSILHSPLSTNALYLSTVLSDPFSAFPHFFSLFIHFCPTLRNQSL